MVLLRASRFLSMLHELTASPSTLAATFARLLQEVSFAVDFASVVISKVTERRRSSVRSVDEIAASYANEMYGRTVLLLDVRDAGLDAEQWEMLRNILRDRSETVTNVWLRKMLQRALRGFDATEGVSEGSVMEVAVSRILEEGARAVRSRARDMDMTDQWNFQDKFYVTHEIKRRLAARPST